MAEYRQGLQNREQQKADAKARAEARNNQPNAFSSEPTPLDAPTPAAVAVSNFRF